MFKPGDIIRVKRDHVYSAWYDVPFKIHSIEDERRVICSPTVEIRDPSNGKIYTPNDKEYWFAVKEIELAVSEEEVIREHLSDQEKYKDEFQAILIGLKRTAK